MSEQRYSMFHQLFANLSDVEKTKSALISGGVAYSYKELDKAIEIFACDLIRMGVKPGEHVGLWSFNTANSVIAYFGIIRAGAVAVLGNYSMTYEETKDLFAITDIKWLVYGITLASRKDPEMPGRLAADLGIPAEHLYSIVPAQCYFRDRLTEEPSEMVILHQRMAEDNGKRTAYVIFTSGSTSKPKAVLDHQLGLLENDYRNLEKRDGIIGEKCVIALPLFHVFGIVMLINYFLMKGTVYLEERVSSDSIIQTLLLDREITDIATVTAIYQGMLEHADFKKIAAQPCLLTTAGGILTPVQYMKLETAFTNAKLFNEYGQTETHGYITSCNWDDPIEKRAFTIGRPFNREEVVIYDSEKGIVPDGELGEILVKNKTLMNGYYKLPEEKQAIDANGWIHTGDIGFYDTDGFIQLAGRIKDIIIKNGENIIPSEIEKAMTEFAEIKDAKVYGVPHPIYGETVACCVVMEPGEAEIPQAELQKRLKTTLAGAKIPEFIIYFDTFPLAASGKMDPKTLRIQMLRRIREIIIHQDLETGIVAFKIELKNTLYNIVPVSMMLRSIGDLLQFNKKRMDRIALAVEEFLTIRIAETKNDVGDIHLRCIFYPEWFSIEFSDSGENYYMEKNEECSFCAKLILRVVDNYYMVTSETMPTKYYMEFLYEQEFDMEKFLMAHDREKL